MSDHDVTDIENSFEQSNMAGFCTVHVIEHDLRLLHFLQWQHDGVVDDTQRCRFSIVIMCQQLNFSSSISIKEDFSRSSLLTK